MRIPVQGVKVSYTSICIGRQILVVSSIQIKLQRKLVPIIILKNKQNVAILCKHIISPQKYYALTTTSIGKERCWNKAFILAY